MNKIFHWWIFLIFFLFIAKGMLAGNSQAYLFAYFTDKNNNKNGLHFAWSPDGYKWNAIGPEYSFLKNDYGNWETEKKMRDPFIMQGPDGQWHCIWTINWESNKIGHASTTDFIHWSRQSYIPVMEGYEVKNCWAPEMIYDKVKQQYIIFWASTIKVNGEWKTEPGKKYDHRMYYTTTKDFKTFSPAKIFFDPGHNVIDVTINKMGNTYYMIYKDETAVPKPQKNLLVAVSNNAEGPYQRISKAPFTKDWVEGPACCLLSDSSFIVYMEAYQDKRYEAMRTRDFISWEDVSNRISIPENAKHGSIISVSMDVVDRLIDYQKESEYKKLENQEKGIIFPQKSVNASIVIDTKQSKPISNMLTGIFFEDINHAADGGLYAELVQNRGFEYSPEDVSGRHKDWNSSTSWEVFTSTESKGSFNIDSVAPLNKSTPHYAVITVEKTGKKIGLINGGFDGIALQSGDKYNFSLFAKSLSGKATGLLIQLIGKNGEVYGETRIKKLSDKWEKYTAVLTSNTTVQDARLAVMSDLEGKTALDMISLFPEKTFKNRRNGLRADLAQTIADIKPRFVRFPGGCLVHGDGLDNMYRWKNTVGPIEKRVPQGNIWRYHQTAGLGYFEYFQFCEDIAAEPIPVVPAGVCCQNSRHAGQEGIPMCEMNDYAQEVLDLIEWANGDLSTTWGKIRAEAGHPHPFNLKYIGVGNEDLISDTFEERFQLIYDTIKKKHPEITVVGTVGPFCEGTDYVEGWKIADKLRLPMVDEHYYQSPGWFINNQDFYDKYDRSKSKVYLGEYASWGNSWYNALAEAAYMTALERNGDIVTMASYAPLLAKEGHTQWNPDLIYFNNTEVKPTVNYHIQKLCGNNSGDQYITSNIVLSDTSSVVKKRISVSVVKDSQSGDLILKLVNILPVSIKTSIQLSGEQNIHQVATKTTIQGLPEDKELTPVISDIFIEKDIEIEIPAWSFTVVRIKKNKYHN